MSDLAPRLLDWLREQYPGRTDLQLGPLSAPSAGYSNVTLLGTLSWREGATTHEQAFVLRLQPNGDSIYPGHDVLRQCRVMSALAATDLPVPRLIGVEPDAALLGSPFYVMERLEGRVPNENPLYHLEGWFHDLTPALQRQCWFAGIETTGRMARLDWRRLDLGFLLEGAGLSRQIDYYCAAILWAEHLAQRDYPLLHAAERWLREHQPHDDRAWWLMLDETLSAGYGVPRLPSLPSREQTIAAWERASGFDATHLEYHEVYAAWRMAFVMARIAHIFKQRGWIAADADMDVRNGGAALLERHGARLGFSH